MSDYLAEEVFEPGFGRYGQRGGVPHSNELLTEIIDNGLLWLINVTVLHPNGYALGYTVNEEDRKITNLVLYKSPDERMCYAPGVDDKAHQKYTDFTLRLPAIDRSR